MNKKEIAEIKKNFSDDCNFFTINRVVTAFVDAEKNIKCKTNQLYNIMPQDESELILANLKKTLSGRIGANLLEYPFPKNAILEGGQQQFLWGVLKSKLADEEIVDNFLNTIVEKVEYVSTYSIFTAHCTYSVLKKTKMDEIDEDSDSSDYNFIITAICPVNLRIDGLIYNEEENAIAKKEGSDRIVEMPTDGFLFPLFNDRAPDVNGVLYYCKNAKKPNTSMIEEFLGCEFTMTGQNEKEVFHSILGKVVADELDYDMITKVNDKIQNFIDQTAHETEIATIDSQKMNSILWEAGVSQEKLVNLDKVFEQATENKPLTAVNLVEKKTVVAVPSITVNIGKGGADKVKTQMIGGRNCLVIALDDPEISINGLEMRFVDKKPANAPAQSVPTEEIPPAPVSESSDDDNAAPF
ncbi:DUF4317 domain-containing protein [Ruminococcus albus]|uniref:DUF4317 domain-containing protein n=1 Tax=Ruminococcus albus (strain ATCC 27210 / DSM 20455 / JCM 14654 / NCDO 2250 / 7) TaxID=697329 RepID=E6UHN7_RUMA7|nr:DUF4317 domain-containing protein [Ruminococcus albus]ADU22086.1 hypothetical protein Rumal_1585 [Ruminococcus albus 7 = DSM 20455]